MRVVRKTGFSKRFEEIDTEIGTSLPSHVVVFVFLKDSSWTQINSKSKNSFCCLVYLIPKESSLSKSFSDLKYVPRIDVFHSFTARS